MKLLDRLFRRDSADVRHNVTVDVSGADAVLVTCSCGFSRGQLESEEIGTEVATEHLRETFRL